MTTKRRKKAVDCKRCRTRRDAVVTALESLFYCRPSKRAALAKAFEGLPDKLARMRVYNDERRSSMNNIGSYAEHLVERLRAMEWPEATR